MKTEKVLALLVVITVVFELMHWTGAGVLLVLTLGTWAMIYFFGAGYFFSGKDFKDQNLPLSVVSGIFW